MADEPDWAIVVKYLYEHDGYYKVSESGEEMGPDDQYNALIQELRKELDLQADNSDAVDDVIDHLVGLGLISKAERRENAELELQPDGFEVAHERQLSKQQTRTNTALVILTFALVLASLVGNWPNPAVQKIGGLLVLLLLIAVVHLTDLLENLPGL